MTGAPTQVRTFCAARGIVKLFPSHGEEPVLDGLDFEVQQGELVAVIGPSGCGKSTLLNIIAGLTEPTRGGVELPSDARVAYVFQRPRLLPWRTVIRNVSYGLERLGQRTRSEIDTTSRKAIAQVNLTGSEDKYPHQLSGGMQQRAALARALAIEPNLLLLDEPLGSLDALTRSYLQDELLGMVRRLGTTTVLVTHDIDEALLLADRVVAMSSRPGRIKAEIRVPFGVDRSVDSVLSHPEYPQIRTRLRALLRPEVEDARAPAEPDVPATPL